VTDDPDQIRSDIERTRAALSSNVDAMGEALDPRRAARRQVDRLRQRATSVRERVMGTTTAVGDRASQTAHELGEHGRAGMEGAARAVHDAPGAAQRGTAGNPLAAGLIAFGVGWLAGSLLPASQPEQRAAQAVKEQAKALAPEMKQAASEVVDQLREPAKEAVTAVQERAVEGARTLREEGTQAASDLREDVSGSVEAVRSETGRQDG